MRRRWQRWRDDTPAAVIRRARIAKHFWDLNFPLSAAICLFLDPRIAYVYLSLVSVYANRAAESAREQAAEARIAGADNASSAE